MSIGMASCLPGEDCDLEELFVRAEEAMYDDKIRTRHAGREA